MVLRQLEIDLTQHCTFTKGSEHEFCLWSELIGGIMSSPNLQKRTALFKDLCSKLLASWCYDSAQCIAAVKDLRLQAGYSAVQMYNLEVLTVAPIPLPYCTVACINLHMPHLCNVGAVSVVAPMLVVKFTTTCDKC